MPTMTCGNMLAYLLEAYGVRHVFGIPGVHNVELYRGLWLTKIRHVSPRHEQGAGFMADGYARSTGRPGVAFVITGPGLTNIATAMGQAYGDSVPMLVIATVNRRHELGFGRGFLHEMPSQHNVAAGLTAFTHTLLRAKELPDVLAAAFAVFQSSRPRPVNLEIPIDVLEEKIDFEPAAAAHHVRRMHAPAASAAAVAEAVDILAGAKRVMILAGGGASDAADEIRAIAERLEAPVQLTTNGRGILPPDHRLLADFGIARDQGRELMNAADAVLAIGTELGETDYEFYATTPISVAKPLIRIDLDPKQMAIGPKPAVGIVANAKIAAGQLRAGLEAKSGKHDAKWAAATIAEMSKIAHIHREPEDPFFDELLATVRDALGDPILVGDSTKPAYRGAMTYRASSPRSFFCSGTGFGTLGFALPAAVGAKIGHPDRPVVALAGDGGLQFTLPELMSAREAEAGVILLIWNNNGYREIKDFMVAKEIKPIAVDIAPPDFLKVAAGMGLEGRRIGSLDELKSVLSKHARKAKAPLVLEAGPWMIG